MTAPRRVVRPVFDVVGSCGSARRPTTGLMAQIGFNGELPMADQIREQTALELFPFCDLAPEEWAARHAHEVRWFDFHRFRYRHPGLDQWLGSLGRLLTSPTELEAARRRHLSYSERFRIAVATRA